MDDVASNICHALIGGLGRGGRSDEVDAVRARLTGLAAGRAWQILLATS